MTPCETRLALQAAGYSPLPVFGKRPPMDEWSSKIDVSAAEIVLWSNLWPHAINTGILTRHTPAFDIDILNQEAAQEIELIVRDFLDDRGRVLTRFGRSPKRAVLLRCDQPFKKITASFDTGERLELLGDGQQIVAFGIHPETRKPYSWHGGQPGEIKRIALPSITEAEAHQLVEEAADLLITRHGYVRIGSPTKCSERKSTDEWLSLVHEPIPEGSRNSTLARLTGHLLRHYVDPLVVVELMQSWNATRCRPPLDPEEVIRTINSIAKRELKRREGTANG
jgi:hypothetical protein